MRDLELNPLEPVFDVLRMLSLERQGGPVIFNPGYNPAWNGKCEWCGAVTDSNGTTEHDRDICLWLQIVNSPLGLDRMKKHSDILTGGGKLVF